MMQNLIEHQMHNPLLVRLMLGIFQEERPLPEDCFDIIVSQLANESPSTTQCVFNSQAGKGRSTMGTVIACIIKVC